MNRIDITKWAEFKISEVFITQKIGETLQVPTGASVAKKDLLEGDIPRITVTGINNGIYGYYKANEENSNYRIYENFISVSFLGTVFYHENKASLDMKVHCLKPQNISLNKYTGKFLVTAISSGLKNSTYSDQISSTVLPYLTIKLPTNRSGDPDWNYMESYMKHIETLSYKKLFNLSEILQGSKHKLEIKNWKEFKIQELFEVKRPVARSLSNYEDGDTPFIASGNYNNGIIKYCTPKKNEILDKGNCITVSPIDASSFYQENDFLGRGGAGSAIILLYNKNLNTRTGLFISSVIRNKFTKYSYNNQLTSSSIITETIKLPVDLNGEPDWQYMNGYIKNTEDKVKNILNMIN